MTNHVRADVRKRWEAKMQLGACPRCGGDLRREEDLYGQYLQCFQCGHYKDEPKTVESSG